MRRSPRAAFRYERWTALTGRFAALVRNGINGQPSTGLATPSQPSPYHRGREGWGLPPACQLIASVRIYRLSKVHAAPDRRKVAGGDFV